MKQRGSTLLEGLISIAIFSIGLLGLAAFQLTAMQQGQQARYRAMASFYAEQLLSRIQADPDLLASFTGTDCAANTSATPGVDSYNAWCAAMAKADDTTMRLPITSAIVANNGDIVTVTIQWAADKNQGSGETNRYITTTNIAFMRALS